MNYSDCQEIASEDLDGLVEIMKILCKMGYHCRLRYEDCNVYVLDFVDGDVLGGSVFMSQEAFDFHFMMCSEEDND